jgi:hypothetical protein
MPRFDPPGTGAAGPPGAAAAYRPGLAGPRSGAPVPATNGSGAAYAHAGTGRPRRVGHVIRVLLLVLLLIAVPLVSFYIAYRLTVR